MTDVTAGDTLPLPAGLPNAGVPVAGVITAGQPDEAQLEQLARGGVEIIADLRAASEDRGFDEPGAAARLGFEYHSIPVIGASIGAREFEAVRSLLRTRGTRPILVHCKSANRVGAALIPWLVLDEHRAVEEALVIARNVGLRSAEMARAAIAYIDTCC
jgi:protein tyrosine phosphatase (PTP) superfamily phosphohydrolase (DUF442 family)